MRVPTLAVVLIGLGSCSKSSTDGKPTVAVGSSSASSAGTNAGSNAGSGSGTNAGSSSGSAAPTQARSAGTLELSGTVTGTFHWNTKGELTCVWHADKKSGGLHMELTDGVDHDTISLMNRPDDAGRDITIAVDAMPGLSPRLTLIAADLGGPLKTETGYELSGTDDTHVKLTIDATLSDLIVDPDAPKKKPNSKTKKPAGPKVTIKGTLTITCLPRR